MKIFNPEAYARAVAAIDRDCPRFSAEREFGLYTLDRTNPRKVG